MSKNSKPKRAEKVSKNPLKRLLDYIKSSFRELRQTRFPNGKATRKMLFSVLVYVAVILLMIWGLDIFFGWIFKLILG